MASMAGSGSGWADDSSQKNIQAGSSRNNPCTYAVSARVKALVHTMLPCNLMGLLPQQHHALLRSHVDSHLLSGLGGLERVFYGNLCPACESTFEGNFLQRARQRAQHYKSDEHFTSAKNFLLQGQQAGQAEMSTEELVVRAKALEALQHVEAMLVTSGELEPAGCMGQSASEHWQQVDQDQQVGSEQDSLNQQPTELPRLALEGAGASASRPGTASNMHQQLAAAGSTQLQPLRERFQHHARAYYQLVLELVQLLDAADDAALLQRQMNQHLARQQAAAARGAHSSHSLPSYRRGQQGMAAAAQQQQQLQLQLQQQQAQLQQQQAAPVQQQIMMAPMQLQPMPEEPRYSYQQLPAGTVLQLQPEMEEYQQQDVYYSYDGGQVVQLQPGMQVVQLQHGMQGMQLQHGVAGVPLQQAVPVQQGMPMQQGVLVLTTNPDGTVSAVPAGQQGRQRHSKVMTPKVMTATGSSMPIYSGGPQQPQGQQWLG